MNDINLEDNDINDQIEDADIIEQTENPYYADVDALNLDSQVALMLIVYEYEIRVKMTYLIKYSTYKIIIFDRK